MGIAQIKARVIAPKLLRITVASIGKLRARKCFEKAGHFCRDALGRARHMQLVLE